jgi:hypothetical protein
LRKNECHYIQNKIEKKKIKTMGKILIFSKVLKSLYGAKSYNKCCTEVDGNIINDPAEIA